MTAVARTGPVVVLEGDPATDDLVLIHADDLRLAQRERARLRAEAEAHGDDPASVVAALVVDVVLEERAADARAVAPARAAGVVTYIGTPAGLQSLISDVYAAKVADAVVLRPVGGPQTSTLIQRVLNG